MPGFLHAFPAKVNRVAATLVIRFDQERLRFCLPQCALFWPQTKVFDQLVSWPSGRL